MKKFLLFSLLLVLSSTAQATECVDRYFKESKINLYLCQNYSNYNETRALLYKGRTQVLNEYIKKKISLGQLLDKRFEIQVYDQQLTYKRLELTQSKTGYYINLSGFATLEQLITLVDYFSMPGWQPFLTSDYQQVSSDVLDRQVKSFYANHKSTKKGFIQELSITVWAKNKIHLEYYHDSLTYFQGIMTLRFHANSSLPVIMKDRVLFFQSDSIFVMQGKKIINMLKINEPIMEDYDIYTSKSWVNICNGGRDNWVYCYAYDQNKFYKRSEIKN